jgi:hypothetical protein
LVFSPKNADAVVANLGRGSPMTQTAAFHEVTARLVAGTAGVEPGRMMSSPALTFRGRVFCFLHGEEMVFKLGKDANTQRPELDGWRWLNPFTNKGPMKAWYVVPLQTLEQWEQLAREALALMSAT